jgi:mersacidin/lichenicidin family type 2 lantibiotic
MRDITADSDLSAGSQKEGKEDFMKNADVIRAWKNEEYRLSLGETQRSMLPPNPAGGVELTDAELGGAAGGNYTGTLGQKGCNSYECKTNGRLPCSPLPASLPCPTGVFC